MPSLVVSLAGTPQSTYAIHRACTRIGRSPGNDIVLAGPTVSGAHAVFLLSGTKLAIEDLGSSNGTFLGRTRIGRADLEDGSIVSIGDYALKLVADSKAMAYEATMLVRSGAVTTKAWLQRLDGPRKGQLLELAKVVSTIGKPGECMLTFIRRGGDFAVRFADGPRVPRLNGADLGEDPVLLNAGDVLELDTGHLQFLLQEPQLRPQAAAPGLHPASGTPASQTVSGPGRAMSRGPALDRGLPPQDFMPPHWRDGSATRGHR